ncbi:hypothetical protein FDP41_005380 [Naegleria fowleri]|uniref:Uncharacterized protein n=1 Tax=Naegleria fowleri TaxID=5763 RepID=A0A6A5BKH0_NAEFO|nr:uncharacterized protein FDP41_005380 [Naegleria fowleri]KAF0975386.1 hypothetical protein FDP41_005380 [Naegleria fowleri]CAG4713699.1 unnamed protein product [Naegleria fowleri]
MKLLNKTRRGRNKDLSLSILSTPPYYSPSSSASSTTTPLSSTTTPSCSSSGHTLLKKRKIKYGVSRVRNKLLRDQVLWEFTDDHPQQAPTTTTTSTNTTTTTISTTNMMSSNTCSSSSSSFSQQGASSSTNAVLLPNHHFSFLSNDDRLSTSSSTCEHQHPLTTPSSISLQEQLQQVLIQVLSQMTFEQFQDRLTLAVSQLFESLLRAKEILEQRQAIRMSDEEKERFTREVLSSEEFQSKLSSISSIFHFESFIKEGKELFIMVSNVIPQQRSVYVASFMKNQPDQ